jgi:hypothetical protein
MRRSIGLVVLAGALSCGQSGDTNKAAERRGPPPPTASAAESCTPGELSDAVTRKLFPAKAGKLCVEGAARSFGADAKSPIEGICDLYDGECQLYLGWGVRRVVEVTYSLGRASIVAHLSRFDGPSHAYALFTKRVVGDGDPALDSTPRPLTLGDAAPMNERDRVGDLTAGAAALGLGSAYLVKGDHVLELTYSDPALDEPGLEKAGDAILPDLVRAVAKHLEGAREPADVRALPTGDRISMGVRFDVPDVLGIKGAGSGALGYHRENDGTRYRTLAAERRDADGAKATFRALTRGGTGVAGLGDEAARVELKEGPLALTWIIARRGTTVLGVGDESRVLRAGMTAVQRDDISLTDAEKKARLGEMLAKPAGER